jgi:carbonyl reductase 1
MSKVGVTALTRIQQRQLDNDPRGDIVVSALCPGYVDTDMTSHKGQLTPEQGAQTPIFLALLPENSDGPKGAFWADQKIFDWADVKWNW